MISPDLDRVRDIVALLPAGPFTVKDFMGTAIGLNAIGNCNQVLPMLEALADTGEIMKVARHLDMWVRLAAACDTEWTPAKVRGWPI